MTSTDKSNNLAFSPEILAVLPQNYTLVSAVSDGTSSWSRTMRVTVEDETGQQKRFFLKFTTGESGRAQLKGEFHVMAELHRTVPHMIPKPQGWGEIKHQSVPTFFLLSDYLKLSHCMPDPKRLAEELVTLHKASQSQSTRFGFQMPTFDGKLPQVTTWDSDWASFFTKLLKGILDLDTQVNGRWEELETLAQKTFTIVIPRLLGRLTQNGQAIKPTLIHGDLWEGNIGTDIETGNIYLFDACSFYAHHEMELGMWRTAHHRMKDKVYKQEYLKRMKPSDPVEEWDDRNRLYSVKTKLMFSAHTPSTSVVRRQAYDDLLYLVNKYAPAEDMSIDEEKMSFNLCETPP